VPNVAKEKYRPNPFRQPIAHPWETEFRHVQWSAVREKVRHALGASGTSTKALDRFDNCGAECLVEWSTDLQKYRLRASFCRCRHCQPCQKAKAGLIAKNLKDKLQEGVKQAGDRFRFITLTLRHSKRPLTEQIKKLYSTWRTLRRSKIWKDSQRGGAVMFEVKLNDKKEWHPHLHIMSEGDFIRQDRLANHWMKLTGDSFVVHVTKIDSEKDVAAYVSKYVAKGVPDDIWSNTQLAIEWAVASKGLHTCATYGTWRGFKILKVDPSTVATDWKPIGLLTTIARQAEEGSIASLKLLEVLHAALQYDPSRGYQKPQKQAG
jgi:hypothetical protein